MFIVLNTVALVFISCSYWRMLRVVRSSGLSLRSTQERQDHALAQRFVVIVATDCLCWIPVIGVKSAALAGTFANPLPSRGIIPPANSEPELMPSSEPEIMPSSEPKRLPSSEPEIMPSSEPEGTPSSELELMPSSEPKRLPKSEPKRMPSSEPKRLPNSEPERMPSSEKPFPPVLGTFRCGPVDINPHTYMNIQQPNSDPEDEGSMSVRNVGNTAHIHEAKAQGQHPTRLERHTAVSACGSNRKLSHHLSIPVHVSTN
jgi:hypothetical protein